MLRVWINVELDHDRELDIKLGDPVTSDQPVEAALALLERATADARRWIEAQRPIGGEED